MFGIFRIWLANYDECTRPEADAAVTIGACKSGTAMAEESLL
jgi:hypothetical protein